MDYMLDMMEDRKIVNRAVVIKEGETEPKTYNVVLNVGLTTADGSHELNADNVMNFIGMYHDCTITQTVGFYHGQRENSLKVEIYDVTLESMVVFARYIARSLSQECVALTCKERTVFVSGNSDARECAEMLDELTR